MATASAVDKLKALLKIVKSVDDATLRDITQIDDYTDDKDKIPSASEAGTSTDGTSMRGGAADSTIERRSDIVQQHGITEDYIKFNERLGRLEKSVGVIAGLAKTAMTMLKADDTRSEEADKKDTAPSTDDYVEKALSSARMIKAALTKAEDCDDDEDLEEELEKAERQISTLKGLVEKAEEVCIDDEDEECAAKARTRFRNLRKSVKDARAAFTAKKSAPAASAAATETAKAAEAVAAAPDVTKAMDALAGAMGIQTKSLQDFMTSFTGRSTGSGAPPTFAKSLEAATPDSIAEAIDSAFDSGLLDNGALMKARSIQSHLLAAKAGRIDLAIVQDEIEKAPEAIRQIFINATPAVA